MPLRIDEIVEVAVEPVDLFPLLAEPRGIEAVGHADALRVVGDGDKLVAAGLGGGDHLGERGFAVAGGRVHVEVALEVAELDELRQLSRRGPAKLFAGLADLGREAGQVHRGVDVALVAAGDVFAFVAIVIFFGLFADAEDAVFVDFEAAVFGHAAEDDVVVLGAGEVLQGGAERFGRHDAEVDLQAAGEPDRKLRVAAADHFGRVVELHQVVHRGGGVFGVDQQVEVADRLAAAAVAAGGLDLPDAFVLAHVGDQLLDDRVGLGPVHPHVGRGGEVDAGEDFFLRLGAEAFELAHLVGLAGGPQHVERIDLEFFVERRRLLGTEPGNSQERHHARRHRGAELFEHGELARLHQLGDLLGQVLANAFDVGDIAFGIGDDPLERLGIVAHLAGRVAIRPHAKRVGALEFQQVGHFVKRGGDIAVVHGCMIRSRESGVRSRESGVGVGEQVFLLRVLINVRQNGSVLQRGAGKHRLVCGRLRRWWLQNGASFCSHSVVLQPRPSVKLLAVSY